MQIQPRCGGKDSERGRYCWAPIGRFVELERQRCDLEELYRPTLSVALVNALTLQTTPQRCLTHFLTIELSPVPEGLSKNLSAIPRSFTVEDVRVNSFEDALASGTPDSEDMKRICADITEKSTPLIASGGLGIGVVQLCVSSLNLAQITPFGFTESLHDLRVEPNWESSLKQAIEKGILV
ncbi:hypothetical protein H0H81_007075 [Sphagnurus paluster]|uniref:Uncharacterized protein n=1 Tax=Sphagnurus paluster TaxID=117069 RepID=A0A9P7KGT8_9AGAR|nr:hypothetical protein H0H81_007075 [Sphagnurus paluster]